ncbi:HD domain-containing protein [Aquimarina gracilis]|uniref:HD domain-containing protein n=1 Tax=Aquimarina gracilis TaxID=874422 RepID=A0ABU5ZT69_9FLAO|nr:HD domain-containing protein [Aquimarina gracilis]MEB3345169.1 HD domain-containing protein [Aquimarina gracilis]
MTQELYQKAIKFAGEKHSNQKVPGTNSNYLLHVSNVAMEVLVSYNSDQSFDIDFAIQTAILHDTIEDTNTDFEEIKTEFGEKIAQAVLALTKNENLGSKKEKMVDSLNRINELQKEVGLVKIADRITNLQTPPKHWSKDKVINYCEEAKLIASTLRGKNNYLNTRLESKINEYEQKIIDFKDD